ncbi:MAG: 50S ribosomal protein L3 [Candidatus Sungbacteria bacterium RIFCSPLOWO2_12_FULL_41_11]|uniref:Large ribosomal subunit protein uL3 n=1 Tax=Candidatus Sungbacteria bacterium RIFCSPLOWO2_12_FULL_41_11 TaxID=1802286 RepID=A0A1G2LQM1_9BACT|nr:MAG: 50S ribosomal protein L3 [Parcubacteria group bacterium GW2011_GWA2_42_14]OGZ98326.1 MAG: 50S ribosomal protein L3 [Candidatus Sungbacteria bacterium RIFCSPHIGHO2_02_FULL_41_12b]OHA13915.1 MAG: 50S ribosomal protein L3 [Candidatus Sungbacteria bacterium RIFCSPLOWO2_12_FULL_41_11]
MKYILGEKIGMSQVFDSEGKVIPVTVVSADPNVVLQVRTKEKDSYEAVQVGFGIRKDKNIKKPQKGHFKDLGNFRYIKEFRTPQVSESKLQVSRGDKFDVSVFKEGDMVKVSGISKSKGFQGVMKRHGFHGAPATHGTKHAHREPGSIGGGGGRAGGRVVKGMKMAGRMGGERVTVKNLKIVKVDAENSLLAISGAVPGRKGTLLEIRG